MDNKKNQQHYRDSGIEIDAFDYIGPIGAKASLKQEDDFAAARHEMVEKFLPLAGDIMTYKDFPAGVNSGLQARLLDSFSNNEKRDISRQALYHETAPSEYYWGEARDTLIERLLPTTHSGSLARR